MKYLQTSSALVNFCNRVLSAKKWTASPELKALLERVRAKFAEYGPVLSALTFFC
jgi:hypothetical protein